MSVIFNFVVVDFDIHMVLLNAQPAKLYGNL